MRTFPSRQNIRNSRSVFRRDGRHRKHLVIRHLYKPRLGTANTTEEPKRKDWKVLGLCSGFRALRKVLNDMCYQSLSKTERLDNLSWQLIGAFETVSVARDYNIIFIWISYLNKQCSCCHLNFLPAVKKNTNSTPKLLAWILFNIIRQSFQTAPIQYLLLQSKVCRKLGDNRNIDDVAACKIDLQMSKIYQRTAPIWCIE